MRYNEDPFWDNGHIAYYTPNPISFTLHLNSCCYGKNKALMETHL